MKRLKDIYKPHPVSRSFGTFDRRIDLRDYHKNIRYFRLHKGVPEDVRAYFETVKDLYVYGWFVYKFFTVAQFLSLIAVEMALRKKFEKEDPNRKWRLSHLIKEAKACGFVRDEGFPHIRRQRKEYRGFTRLMRFEPAMSADYMAILQKAIPNKRNYFAHPSHDTIDLPGGAWVSIQVATGFINQLFPKP